MSATVVLLAVAAMVLAAPMVFAPGRWGGAARAATPWLALLVFAVALAGPRTAPHHPAWLLTGTLIGLDPVGRVFLIAASAVWAASAFQARVSIPPRRRASFTFFFLMAMAGNFLAPIAADVVTFYIGFALVTFAAYGLIIHTGNREANRAGRIYLVMAVVGEMFLLSGLLLATTVAGTTALHAIPGAIAGSAWTDIITLCFLFGFGIKAGIVPLHFWLPLAHPVAPPPASAVLSGAMVNVGLLGWIRCLPLGYAILPGWGVAALVVGMFGAFFGVAAGLLQRDVKTVLAYSTISQIGLMNAALGIGLLDPAVAPVAIAAVTLYAAHHGLTKGALFLGVGVLGRQPPASRARRWVLFGLLLPVAALAGIPFTSGALAKSEIYYLAETASVSSRFWLVWLLPVSVVATTLLMTRFVALLPTVTRGATAHAGGKEGPSLWLTWAVLAIGAVIALHFDPIWGPVAGSREQELPDVRKTLHDLVPITVGVAVAVLGAYLWRWRRPGRPAPTIEPGDILIPFEAVLVMIPWRGRFRAADSSEVVIHRLADLWYRRYAGSEPGDPLLLAELRLTRWSSGAALLLAVAVVMIVLMAGVWILAPGG